MKQKRRWISLLLTLCLLVGLFPTAAVAASNGQAIQLGTEALSTNVNTTNAAKVYFGKNNSDVPYAYYVIGYGADSGVKTSVSNSSTATLLAVSSYGTSTFDSKTPYSNEYGTSNLKLVMDEIAGKLTDREKSAVQSRTLETGSYSSSAPYTDGIAGDAVNDAIIWPLSTYEADQVNSSVRQLDATSYWWLRSPGFDVRYAARVAVNGYVYGNGGDVARFYDVRPAFNLNLNSVLFVSAAEGAKTGTDGLAAVEAYTGSEWKLTLKDSSRDNFSVVGTTAVNENTLTVAYSGATTGENEYISAIVTDENDDITYYGRIKSVSSSEDASGTVEITLPDDFGSENDTLYLFSEQYNGDKYTDYASALREVSLSYSVEYELENLSTDGSSSVSIFSTDDYEAKLSVSGDYALPESITVTVGGDTLTAGTDYTYDSATGDLTIYAAAIDGDIVITASAELSDIAAPSVAATAGGASYTSGSWTSEDVTLTVSGSSAPSGIDKYQYSTDGGASWTDLESTNGSATLTVSDNSETENGTSYIFRAVSNDSNEGTQSTVFVVKIDKKQPTIDVEGKTGDYLQSDTVEITATAGVSGVAKVEVNGTDITDSYADGYTVTENGTYTFTVTNGVGATASTTITYDKLDSVQPKVAVDTNGYTSGEWTNADVTLTVTNTAENLGTTTFEYKTDDGGWQTYTDPITVSDETSGATYTFRAISESGMVSEEVSVTVKIDKTAPTDVQVSYETNSFREFLNTITFGLFFKDTVDVTISATDSGSGVQEITYQLSDGETTTVTAQDGKITFSVEPQFKGNISSVIVTDNAGNSSDSKAFEYFAVDSETPAAPAVEMTAGNESYTSGEWTAEDVTITVSGATALSGIAKYQYSTDGGESWTDMTAVSSTAATADEPANVTAAQLTVTDQTSENGVTYLFRAVSNSEMEGESATVTVKLDKTQPDIVVTGDTENYLQNDTVEISATAGVSGVAKVEVSKDDGEAVDITEGYINGYTVTENGTYTFTVTNGVGATASTTITYDKLDSVQPIVEVDTNGYTSGEWTNADVTLTVTNTAENLGTTTLEYKIDNGGWQTYTDPITVSDETSGTTYTFRAISASGMVSEEVSVIVKIDKTAPDGDIEINENSVKTFINAITFGLFFNENVDVTISAEDSGSGVKSVEYYRSAEILTEEQAAAITDWAEYGSAISETAEDAETFIYYVKITDNAGNVTCFASNGAVFDLTAPVISGVTDGETYYTTQKVTVDDVNIDSVTVNGEAAGTEITLAGNTDITYTIIATDKAGNETTVTVTMKPTESLYDDALEDITSENVTSDDKDKIEEYLEDLNERLEDENLTDEEKEIIDSLIDKAEDLLEKLEEAEQAGNTDAIDKVQDITPDNVTPEDKEDLEQAKEDIESALENYGDHYTDEEKAQLEEALERIEAALEVIERIEEVEAAIEALPDSVVPSDTETAERINAAKDLYDDLTDYEQSLISDGAKEKLEDLLAQLGDYRITDGDGSTWTKGSGEDLTITANGASDKLVRVEIDGETLSSEYYTVTGENTVITISADYLETLAAGGHTITVIYTDGEAAGTFAVAEQQAEPSDDDTTADDTTSTGVDNTDTSTTSPQTGDDSNIALWIALMLAAGAALTGTILYSRKRKYSR